jgi:hypothetical protein
MRNGLTFFFQQHFRGDIFPSFLTPPHQWQSPLRLLARTSLHACCLTSSQFISLFLRVRSGEGEASEGCGGLQGKGEGREGAARGGARR